MTTADFEALLHEAQADAIRTLRELCTPLPPAPEEGPEPDPDGPASRPPNPLEARRIALRERAIRLRAATAILRHTQGRHRAGAARPLQQSDHPASPGAKPPAPAASHAPCTDPPSRAPSPLRPSADPTVLAKILDFTPLERHIDQSHIDLKSRGINATPTSVANHIRGIISYEQAFNSPYRPQPGPATPATTGSQNTPAPAAKSAVNDHP